MSSRHKHNDLPWYLKDFIENENIESTEGNRGKNVNTIELNCNESTGSKDECSSQEKYVCQDETNCFRNNEQRQEKETMEASSTLAMPVQEDINIDINSIFYVYDRRSYDANEKSGFEFKRFTGSIDELEKKSSRRNHLKPDKETRTMGLYAFRTFRIEWTSIFLILLWVLFLTTPLLRRDAERKKDSKVVVHDGDGEQSNNTVLSLYSSEEENGNQESSEIDRSSSKDSAETPYLEKSLSSKIEDQIGNNREEEEVTVSKYSKSSKLAGRNVSQDASKNASNFGNHVEMVAEAISKSCGLDRKDSLQIAVSQVLSDHRHKAQIEIDRTRAKVQKKEEVAQKAIADLKRLMTSIMFGRILALSVTLQVLLSNFNDIRVLSIHYLPAQSNEIWSTLWGIVVEKICGCKSVGNSSLALLFSERLPYILLSILSTEQTMVAICIARLILQMTVVVIAHKCVSIFHSQILHQIINLTVLVYLLLNTQVGFSIIRTIVCMVVYNMINCVLTVANLVFLKLDHVQISPVMEVQPQDSDEKMIMEKIIGDYDMIVSHLSHSKRKLLVLVFLGSVLLPDVYITQDY
ncbi:predicted protein [Chaetoceros tenuissimus]|uniref:Uncharacterized protein n=1 Tax=Chaetoceros tenuissimus TaxID=426638 RepID=A0AAD3H683_9STRA|nr:predicted protein [Chaetoceros tenuissimus]